MGFHVPPCVPMAGSLRLVQAPCSSSGSSAGLQVEWLMWAQTPCRGTRAGQTFCSQGGAEPRESSPSWPWEPWLEAELHVNQLLRCCPPVPLAFPHALPWCHPCHPSCPGDVLPVLQARVRFFEQMKYLRYVLVGLLLFVLGWFFFNLFRKYWHILSLGGFHRWVC